MFDGHNAYCPERNQEEDERMTRYKAVRAFQNNGPDYWLIFCGTKTFGADPIARCDNVEDAHLIVNALNLLENES